MRLSNLILLLAYFNEIYILGLGRIFDIVIYLLLIVFLFLRKGAFPTRAVFLLFFIVAMVLLSLILYMDLRLSSAMVFGIILMLYYERPTNDFVLSLLRIHVFALLLQMSIFYVIGVHFSLGDLVPGLDVSRNLNVDLGFYRPSGLFLEPNAYVINSAYLLILSWQYIPRTLYIFLLGSILLSKSVFGIGFVMILIFYSAPRHFKLLFLVLGLLSTFTFLRYGNDVLDTDVITFRRFGDIISGSDPSVEARLKGEKSFDWIDYLIPHGFDFNNYMKFFGINGVSMLLYSFGIFGWIFLTLIFIRAITDVRWLIFLLTLFSYPYIAYCIFYIILKSLFHHGTDCRPAQD